MGRTQTFVSGSKMIFNRGRFENPEDHLAGLIEQRTPSSACRSQHVSTWSNSHLCSEKLNTLSDKVSLVRCCPLVVGSGYMFTVQSIAIAASGELSFSTEPRSISGHNGSQPKPSDRRPPEKGTSRLWKICHIYAVSVGARRWKTST